VFAGFRLLRAKFGGGLWLKLKVKLPSKKLKE
jgi:hypothetical protein